MKKNYELGMDAGKIAIMLFRENTKGATKYGHNLNAFRKYLTGNVIGGTYPMPRIYATAGRYAKTKKSVTALDNFVKDIATAGLTSSSFYASAGRNESEGCPWIGQEFEDGFIEAIMKRG